jgi:hypothetical protein
MVTKEHAAGTDDFSTDWVEEPTKAEERPLDTKVYLDGSETEFSCTCGATVFKRIGSNFQCRGCGTLYLGGSPRRVD